MAQRNARLTPITRLELVCCRPSTPGGQHVGVGGDGGGPTSRHSTGLWIPYPSRPEWGAYTVAWKQAA